MGLLNLLKKPETPVPAVAERDPFHFMREMLAWEPPWKMDAAGYAPAFEVKETKEAFLFKADLPGVKEADLEVALTGNRLTIGGTRAAEEETKNETIYVYERAYGTFTRMFTLPDGIDAEHVRAELKDGELRITVPKLAAAQPRKIAIGAGQAKA